MRWWSAKAKKSYPRARIYLFIKHFLQVDQKLGHHKDEINRLTRELKAEKITHEKFSKTVWEQLQEANMRLQKLACGRVTPIQDVDSIVDRRKA